MSEPVLVALLFADKVITENNGKKGIIGTFNRFQSPKFPVVFPPWAIYAALTNLGGVHQFELKLINNDTGQDLMPIKGEFRAEKLNDVVELVYNIGGVAFPEDGTYTLTLRIDQEMVGTRQLLVVKTNDPTTEHP